MLGSKSKAGAIRKILRRVLRFDYLWDRSSYRYRPVCHYCKAPMVYAAYQDPDDGLWYRHWKCLCRAVGELPEYCEVTIGSEVLAERLRAFGETHGK